MAKLPKTVAPADEIMASPPNRARLYAWLVTSFTAGAVIMALEMAAFRLYAPYLGYSIYVWGTMIAIVMVALALGYAIGGWLADGTRSDRLLYGVIFSSGVYQAIVIAVSHPLLKWLAQFGEVAGSVYATLIIYTIPLATLAIVGPYLIRLLARTGHVGATAGQIYALSTVGSILGVVGTIFYLVPELGTQMTLKVCCGATLLLGTVGLAMSRKVAGLGVLSLAVIPFLPDAAWGKDTIWTRESAYNLIRVKEKYGVKMMILNDSLNINTVLKPGSKWTGFYVDDYALAPLLVSGRRALVLGLGAGASAVVTHNLDPTVTFDAVEIDPLVVRTGILHFELPEHADWLRVFVDDARPWLSKGDSKYDFVHIDLFQGGRYIPFYLCTEECFAEIRARMTDDSVLIMNVIDLSPEREMMNTIAATMKTSFPTVMVLSRSTGNQMLFAFTQPKTTEWARRAIRSATADEQFMTTARAAADAFELCEPPANTRILTDDNCPVEQMTRRMLQYLPPSVGED